MILEKIKNCRSHRNFSSKSISKEEILKILEAARYSSCGKNLQELRYSYIIDEESTKNLFSNFILGGLLKKEDKATLEERPRAAILISVKSDNKNEMNLFNIGIVSQNILLAASDFNYSGCIVMAYNKKEVEKIFNLPEDYSSKVLLVLGEATDKVEIVDVKAGESTNYYRENGIHYTPKLALEDLILNK